MTRRRICSWLMDMDGVLVQEQRAVPGAQEFLARLRELGLPFLVLTNNSIYTQRDLAARLMRTALHDVGYTLSGTDPDYVVLGETRTYSFERITQAIRLVAAGSRFIATNPDNVGPSPEGPLPATGSVAALISRATGVDPYYVGKPNPLMMRSALNAIEAHSETTAMIGDRMDTDVVAGLEAGLETILVLTGVTGSGDVERFGRLDIAVANAGVGSYGPFLELDPDDLEAMIDLNLKGTLYTAAATLPHLIESGAGDFVSLASVAGVRAFPGEAVYNASKFGQVGFTRALDHELREKGVRATNIAPGGVNTEFAIGTGREHGDPDLERMMSAEDVAEVVLFAVTRPRNLRVLTTTFRPMSEGSSG